MAKQKREINEEFADVWSEIISERVEVLKQKLMEETDEKKARYFDGYIDGMVETLTLFLVWNKDVSKINGKKR